MQKNILISVIVPVYNVEQYLERCVDSILAQTYSNLEVILVDDGTKDSGGLICDAYAQKDTRVRVIHKENGGLSSARNAGIDIAQGEYISFVDSDDWIEPDALEKLLNTAIQNQVELVIGGRWDVKAKTGEKTLGLCPEKMEVVSAEEAVSRIFRWDHCDSASWDKLYHRRLFQQIRFPYGMIVEDVPIMYKIVLDAGHVAFLNKPIYNYFHREGSITTSKLSEKTFHFSRHTSKILPDIQQNHPNLEAEARYLRVRSLVYSVLSVDLASPEDRKKFQDVCCQERKLLRGFAGFILTSPLFGRKEKIMDLLLAIGWYRGLRNVVKRFKT